MLRASRPRRLAVAITTACALFLGALGAAQPAAAAPIARPSWVVSAVSPTKVTIAGGTVKERAVVRGYLNKWANNTHIEQVTIGKCGHSGLTTMFLTGMSRVCIQSGLKPKALRYVVAHEVAHAAQVFAYRGLSTSYDYLMKSMSEKFGDSGTRALENGADCGAHALTGTNTYNHYTKKCTAKQLKAARTYLAGNPV